MASYLLSVMSLYAFKMFEFSTFTYCPFAVVTVFYAAYYGYYYCNLLKLCFKSKKVSKVRNKFIKGFKQIVFLKKKPKIGKEYLLLCHKKNGIGRSILKKYGDGVSE